MHPPSASSSGSGRLAKLPGLTSLIRTGRGLMTLQTEIVGQPAELVTIVDFRGRVLKTWRQTLAPGLEECEAQPLARRWHADIEARVRANLQRAAQRQSGDETLAHLFLAAAGSYAGRDLHTARAVLEACELLAPDERRIRDALAHLRALAKHRHRPPLTTAAQRPVSA